MNIFMKKKKEKEEISSNEVVNDSLDSTEEKKKKKMSAKERDELLDKKVNDKIAELNDLVKNSDKMLSSKSLNKEQLGVLYKYTLNSNITDINWNGYQLWVDDLKVGRYLANEQLSQEFINKFSGHVSNIVSNQFNKYQPVLEAEANDLRISIVHEAAAVTGRTISIRSIPKYKRIEFDKDILNGNYCDVNIANLMSNAVKAKFNIIVCGLPGTGKTELVKYLTNYIRPEEKTVTVENVLEIHYKDINPGKNCSVIKINSVYDYEEAIRSNLRQLPDRLILSEARGAEVAELLHGFITGISGMSTIHTDDVRRVPTRLKNMIADPSELGNIDFDIYQGVDMAILVKKKFVWNENKRAYDIVRRIEQVATFDVDDDDKRTCNIIADNGVLTGEELQTNLVRKMLEAGIEKPYEYTYLR